MRGWKVRASVAAILLLHVLVFSACGQWLEQNVTLSPGHNAVCLTVDPEPSSCDDLLAAYPQILRVIHYLPHFSTFEFSTDPTSTFVDNPDWLWWLPRDHEQVFLRNLTTLAANRAYVFVVDPTAVPFSINIKGRPVPAVRDWRRGAFSLTGLPVSSVNPPSFAAFFAHSDAIGTTETDGGEIYQISSTGRGQRIIQTTRARIEAGKAYWIKAKEYTDFAGRMQVSLDAGDTLVFGEGVSVRDVSIENVSSITGLTVRVNLIDSTEPPAGLDLPELAGPVPLSYFNMDLAQDTYEWTPLTGELARALEPGEAWRLRLSVRWEDVVDYTPTGTNGAAYMSVLEFTDANSSLRQCVGVNARNEWRGE